MDRAELERLIGRTYSELRATIVLAGGIELSDEQLAAMKVDELLRIAMRNGISLHPHVNLRCPGCGGETIHKMCPAWGTPDYMSGQTEPEIAQR